MIVNLSRSSLLTAQRPIQSGINPRQLLTVCVSKQQGEAALAKVWITCVKLLALSADYLPSCALKALSILNITMALCGRTVRQTDERSERHKKVQSGGGVDSSQKPAFENVTFGKDSTVLVADLSRIRLRADMSHHCREQVHISGGK